MNTIDVLRNASSCVYDCVRGMAGTPEAGGDYGRGAGGDISRRIDMVAEKAVLDHLKESGLGCTVLGEECGRVELPGGRGGYVIMDAVDGSANAVRGVPFFCCSLAFAAENSLSSITDAVVTDLSNGNQYWASRGEGAFLNGDKIRVHGPDPLYRVVGINMSGASADLTKRLQPVFEQHNHIRHFGANALEMAMFACGLMDIFIDLRKKIRVQDVAGGYLLVREAGGLIVDEDMEPLDADLGYDTRVSFIAASGREILDEVMSGIGRA